MLERISARQDARVRRQRDHGVRVSEIVADALSGQTVQIWRGGWSAVGAQGICAERVDGDEQNVLAGNRPEIGLHAG